jgi:hypothetical protein
MTLLRLQLSLFYGQIMMIVLFQKFASKMSVLPSLYLWRTSVAMRLDGQAARVSVSGGRRRTGEMEPRPCDPNDRLSA